MILWSILTRRAWTVLRKQGVLRADRSHADPDRLHSYEWMIRQMEKRLKSPRPSSETVPIWAWKQWIGIKQARPDLRSTWHLPTGTRGVRVECDIPEERVLLSDFQTWHWVLNYWYLSDNEVEVDAFERAVKRAGCRLGSYLPHEPLPSERLRRRLERSWERVFDLERIAESGYPYNDVGQITMRDMQIQATLWEIRLEDVVAYTDFRAR